MSPQETIRQYLPYYIQKAQYDHYFYMILFIIVTFLMLITIRLYRKWLKDTKKDHDIEGHTAHCFMICVFLIASITTFGYLYESYFTYIYAIKNIVSDLKQIIPSSYNWNFSVQGLK